MSAVYPEKCSAVLLRSERRLLIAKLAGPRDWDDTRESWLARAARNSRLTYRTIKALYYDEHLDPSMGEAVDKLKEAANRYEIENLADRIEELARIVRSVLVTRDASNDQPRLPL